MAATQEITIHARPQMIASLCGQYQRSWERLETNTLPTVPILVGRRCGCMPLSRLSDLSTQGTTPVYEPWADSRIVFRKCVTSPSLLSSLLAPMRPPPSLHPSNTANNTKASNTERSKAYHRRLKLCTTLTTLPPLSAAHRSQNSRVRKENITTNDSSIYLNKYII